MEKTAQQLEADIQAAGTDLRRAVALNALARHLWFRDSKRARDLAAQAHSLSDAHKDSQDPQWKEERAESLCILSRGSLVLSQYDLCVKQGEEAIALFQELEPVRPERSRAGKAEALICISPALMCLGDRAGATARLEESLVISRSLGNKWLEGRALNNLGNVFQQNGDYAKALELEQKAQALFRAARNKQGEASALNNTANCQSELGNLAAALECHLQSLAIQREIGDRHGESCSLNNIATIHVSLGNYDKALACLEESVKIKRAIGDRRREASSLNTIADVYTRLEDYPRALEYAQQALGIEEEIGDQEGICLACGSMGGILCQSGSHEEGLEHLIRAFVLSRKLGLRAEECGNLMRIGQVYAQQPEAARNLPTRDLARHLNMEDAPSASLWLRCLERALEIARELSVKNSICEAHLHLSEIHKTLGDFEKALEHLEQHDALRDEIYSQALRRQISNLRISFQSEGSRREAESLQRKNEDLSAVNEQLTREIAARKKAEEQWRRLEQLAGQARKMKSLNIVAGSVAHNFNNLLTGVLGNLELALSRLEKNTPARHLVEQANQAANRAADLSRMMLLYVGQGREIPQAIDLSGLVKETLEEQRFPPGIAVRCSLPDGLMAVQGGRGQIRQVVLNLLANARESLGDAGGAITLSTSAVQCDRDFLLHTYLYEDQPEGPYVRLEVSDTGCGMDKATMDRAFDPFFTKKATGRGLGLAAVLGIVRGHRGAISVSSELGKGSAFRILFPALSYTVAQAPAAAGRPEDRGTVLLVDDEESVRFVGTQMLQRAGFRVLTASSGPEAVFVFRENSDRIACVLLDLNMAGSGGAATFAELRQIRGDVPVVICSAHERADAMARFGAEKPGGYIQKPYRSRDLVAELKKALESRPAS